MSDTLFVIPLWADVLAVVIGSVQGALFASGFHDRRLDLLGVAMIGMATGLGGGLLRDLFLNVSPVAFQTNWYLLTAVLASLLGMLLNRLFTRLSLAITGSTRSRLGCSGPSEHRVRLPSGCPPCLPSSSE